MDITKAIIPAAGFGTRFLPYTKAVPKEMLPLIKQPAIQRIIEEGLASSISNFLIVTSRQKQAIANHFDSDPELEMFLQEHNKLNRIASIEKVIRQANFTYIRQSEALGLGHAIWTARHSISKEYFGIFLPDDIIVSKNPGMGQLIRVARQEKASVIAVQEVPLDRISAYGVIEVKKQITPNLFQVSRMVEKPSTKDAPSNLAIIGRYVLSHKIFQSLEEISDYSTGELQLTDGISHMMKQNEKVYAYKVQGTRFDIGTPIGWLKAVLGIALRDPEYAPEVRKFLEQLNNLENPLLIQRT